MEHVTCCPLCDAESSRLWRTVGSWRLRSCRSCDLIFLSPRPTPAELDDLYTKDYFETFDMKLAQDQEGIDKQTERVDIIRQFKRSGRVLDVGCGNGYFLVRAGRAGFESRGIDVSDWATRYAKENFGLNVETSALAKAHYAPGSFDVITLWHNLEHQRRPVEALRRLGGWLADDGVLVVRVPDVRGFDARWYRGRWHGLSLPYHLVHFSPETLRRALAAASFHPVWWDHRLPQPLVNLLAKRHARRASRRHATGASSKPRPTHAVSGSVKAKALRAFARLVRGRDITVVTKRACIPG